MEILENVCRAEQLVNEEPTMTVIELDSKDNNIEDVIEKMKTYENVYYGQSYLKKAIEWNSLEMVKLIFKQKTDVNHKYTDEEYCLNDMYPTPLFLSIRGDKDIEIVKLLIKNGANLKDKDSKGNSVLYTSLMYEKRIDIIKLFVDLGLVEEDPNAFQNINNIRLSYEIIKLLIDNGAALNTDKIYGSVLSDSIMSINECHHTRDEKFKIIKLLVENGADVNFISKDGFSILQEVAKYIPKDEQKKYCELLIKHGANVHYKRKITTQPFLYVNMFLKNEETTRNLIKYLEINDFEINFKGDRDTKESVIDSFTKYGSEDAFEYIKVQAC
uniref:Uncharacterized protein n=1 Tax=viral metagenome TaxID=1070528 RepID=A0A6C0JR70_9ZZZZ